MDSGCDPHRVVRMRRPVQGLGTHGLAGAQVDLAGGQIAQGDAVVHRAHRYAQVAAHAVLFPDLEVALAVLGGGDGLVRGVFADHMAAPAFDALVGVDDGLADVVEVEEAPVADRGHGAAGDLGHRGDAHVVHVVGQAAGHVLHDLEAVHHGGGAHLHA